jgi:hypothetical protein
MSMYGMVFGGENPTARALLKILEITNVGRFRDGWVERGEDGEPVIAIYTRNGGGNRDCFCDDYEPDSHPRGGVCLAYVIAQLGKHPLYLRDADDKFDQTYATFYFRCPEGFEDILRGVMVNPVDMDERWLTAIDYISGKAPHNEGNPE